MQRTPLLLLLVVVAGLVTGQFDFDEQECKAGVNCVAPKCYCRTQEIPIKDQVNFPNKESIPQFIMLTFDDAVNAVNMDFYRELLMSRSTRNNSNNCPITATFFVSHEYNNYMFINELYNKGNEIASHSITHSYNTDEWRNKNKTGWKAEMAGMRQFLETFAGIPKGQIKGIRVPFLQTSGDTTFEMLRDESFLYDSSMATRSYSHPPIWPYTLDLGFDQDCVIEPCPENKYPGLWEVPMVSFWKERVVIPGEKPQDYPCAMADACIPFPETAAETKDYFMKNFKRHYDFNRAPFPIFLHEAWLKNPQRKAGYLAFVDEILQKYKDVYFVTIQEVIEFMQTPSNVTNYRKKICREVVQAEACSDEKRCVYKAHGEFHSERIMFSCKPCPRNYPWIQK